MENDKIDLEELLVLYALGELEPDEVSAVEEELQKHPELAAKVDKVRQTDGLLSDVFALSDEDAQQELVKESAKPMVSDKLEKPKGRLAYRMAFSVAVLALVVVVGALLYPEFLGKNVHVAMAPNEPESIPASSASDGVKQEESAPVAQEAGSEQTQEETTHLDAEVAEEAAPAQEAHIASPDVAPEESESDPIAEDENPSMGMAPSSPRAMKLQPEEEYDENSL